ncbi:MAG: hypothetical protein BWX78_00131 [Firmicutes bacterium ADurb.Bin099]|nr:MAG: hypothetical protein BWX78_00131 [Firmicutes bacterium ADurb.Bin099]
MNAKIKCYNNRPTIFIDGKPVPPIIYALTDWIGGRLSYDEITGFSIKKFAAAGIRLYQLDISFQDMWFEDGTFDISIALKQIKGIIDVRPDAAVFFRLHINPPRWWYKGKESEWVRYANTEVYPEPDIELARTYILHDLKPVPRASFASEKWINDMTIMVRRFLEELYKSPLSEHLAGIQVANGVYGEQHYWAFMRNDPDLSEPMLKRYRKFKNDPNAQIPGMEERYNPKDGIFFDPEKDSNLIDYLTCQHEVVAESIIHFCKLVKDTWKREIITGVFYGYYVSMFGRAGLGGHLAEEMILQCPYVDFLSAPQAYNSNLRHIGGAGVARGLLESARLNNKLFLDEMDHPTELGVLHGGMKVYPPYESLQILRRNTLVSFLSGMGFWYYDFGPFNTSGWWYEPYYLDEIKSLQKIYNKYYEKEYIKRADVLLVFDTKVQKYTALTENADPITDKACINVAYPMALRSGASMDTIYLSDLGKTNLDKYKCIIFMNTFALTDTQKQYIAKKVYKKGRSIVWFFAPGYTDKKRNDIAFCKQVSGFDLDVIAPAPQITVQCKGFSYSVDNSDKESKLNKLFVPKDGNILGYIGKTPALAHKTIDGCDVYFSSIPFTTPESFRYIFERSGVHIYDSCNDAVIEGSNLLLIHAEHKGERVIKFRDSEITVDFQAGETILFDINTKAILRRGEQGLTV